MKKSGLSMHISFIQLFPKMKTKDKYTPLINHTGQYVPWYYQYKNGESIQFDRRDFFIIIIYLISRRTETLQSLNHSV